MTRKHRVCIIRQYYFPRETHLRRDVKALIDSGLEVDVICGHDKGETFHDCWNGVNIYRLPVGHSRKGILRYIYEYLLFAVLAFFLLTLLFLKKGYSVIEVDTMPDFLIFSAIIPKVFGAKLILYLFENMPRLFSHKFHMRTSHPFPQLLRIIENTCTKFADRTIMTYQRRESYLKDAIVLLNVPDEESFSSKGISVGIQTDGSARHNRAKIMTHSTLSRIYGIQNIIKGVGLVVNRIPNLKCEILGSGEYYEELVKLTNSLKLNGHVVFKGFVQYDDLPRHLLSADIGIVSMLTELLPNKLFEYVALGIPVICADFESVRDFFSSEELLFYNHCSCTELASCIEWALSHYSKVAQMAKRARERYQKYYCWQRMKARYLGCYKDLLE